MAERALIAHEHKKWHSSFCELVADSNLIKMNLPYFYNEIRMIKPAWWAQCATPAAFKDCICVVLSAGWIFSWGEMSGSTAGELHYSSRQLLVREGKREHGTGSPEKAFDPVSLLRYTGMILEGWNILSKGTECNRSNFRKRICWFTPYSVFKKRVYIDVRNQLQ